MTEKESIKKADFHLFEEILALSVATEWKDAAQEWRLFWVDRADEGTYCICGHFIKEMCFIENARAAIYRAQILIDSQVYDYYDEELDDNWIDYTDPWVSLYGIVYTSWDGEY